MNSQILPTKTTAALLSSTVRHGSARLSILAIVAATSLQSANAQTWDKSQANGYVQAGYSEECTAFAHGRFKTLNNEWLRYLNGSGKRVFPDAKLMFDYAVESATVYRDTAPVAGGLVAWTGPNGERDPGHAGGVESVKSDGSVRISEQNWPKGSGPSYKDLSASKLQNRDSTSASGVKKYYKLRGFVNPNRPTAIGTLFTQPLGKQLQLDMALMDEDRRSLRVLAAIVDGKTTVAGTSLSGTVPSNRTTRCLFPTGNLRRGKTYTVTVWVWDFKDLRSTKSKTFVW
jgi:surface antigen